MLEYRPMKKRSVIVAAIIENHLSRNPLKPRDLAQKMGFQVETVHRTTARLRKEGLIPPSTKAIRAAPNPETLPQSVEMTSGEGSKKFKWVQKDVDAILNDPIMPENERLDRLSRIARTSSDAVSITAIRALEDLSRSKGLSIGPSAPLDDEDKTLRLARLMSAVGKAISREAFRRAFPSEDHVELPQAQSPDLGAGTSIGSGPME